MNKLIFAIVLALFSFGAIAADVPATPAKAPTPKAKVVKKAKKVKAPKAKKSPVNPAAIVNPHSK